VGKPLREIESEVSINPNEMQTALNVLEAKAQIDGTKHEVHLRTAWH
jgi:hypothetical protein